MKTVTVPILLVHPRGIDPYLIEAAAKQASYYWLDVSGRLHAVRTTPLPLRGGLVFPINLGMRTILFSQFNDNRWKAITDTGLNLPITGTMVEIPIHVAAKSVTLTRDPSLWRWLILLMWLPPISLAAICRVRKCVSA